MLRSLLVLTMLAAFGIAFSPGAQAQEDGAWVTPPDWPLALFLPPDGELLLRGDEGAEDAGLADDDDLQWSLADEEIAGVVGTGYPFMINATHFELGLDEVTNDIWTDFDAKFMEEMAAEEGTLIGQNNNVELGGTRWMVYHFQAGDPEVPESVVDYEFAMTLTPDYVYMLGLFMSQPPDGALDSALALLIEGAGEE